MSSESQRPGVGTRQRRPASWQVALGGIVAQVAVAAAVAGSAVVSNDPLASLAGRYLLALVVLAGASAVVPAALLWTGRFSRAGVALSVLVGVGVLAVTEFALATLVLPLSLFLAAALGWREGRETTLTDG